VIGERLRGDTLAAIDAAFDPASVAVVGASVDTTKVAGLVVPNLLHAGYRGHVYPVNPRRTEVGGLTCYPSLLELPGPIDAAFIVLPAAQCPAAARDSARAGAKVAVVASSGFAESDTAEGRALTSELRAVVADTGMRLIGPNTNGLYRTPAHLALGYHSTHSEVLEPGPLAVLSHSGALFSVIAGRARSLGIGLSCFVSVGNEADLTILDFLEHAIGQPDTQVIGLIIEALRDGDRFRDLAERAHARGKAIVALKIGESAEAQAAARAHSSRVAGDARLYRATFEQCGVVAVRTAEGLATAAALLRARPTITGSGIAAVSVSGAGGALSADAAKRHGIPLAPLSAGTAERLERYRRFSPVLNPVDLGAIGSENAAGVLGILAEDADISAVVLYLYQLQRQRPNRIALAQAFAAIARVGKPLAVLAPGGIDPDEDSVYRSAGIAVLHDTDVCFEALGSVLRAGTRPSPDAPAAIALSPASRSLLWGARDLTETESRAILAEAGIRSVESVVVRTADEAVRAARAHGAVALKGIAAGVLHKTDADLVMLDVPPDAAGEAFRRLVERGRAGGHPLEAALVSPMLRGGIEVLVGATRDTGLGGFLVAGLGGIHAEALDEVALWRIPTDAAALGRALASTQLGRILASSRWRRGTRVAELIEILLRLQALMIAADGIQGIDVNPLLLRPDGALALDARVTLVRST